MAAQSPLDADGRTDPPRGFKLQKADLHEQVSMVKFCLRRTMSHNLGYAYPVPRVDCMRSVKSIG